MGDLMVCILRGRAKDPGGQVHLRGANLSRGLVEDQPEVQPEVGFVLYILQRLTRYLYIPANPVSY